MGAGHEGNIEPAVAHHALAVACCAFGDIQTDARVVDVEPFQQLVEETTGYECMNANPDSPCSPRACIPAVLTA